MSLSSTPSLGRRGKDGANSSISMDMESIRARRAKLEQILSAMRPPPLTQDSPPFQQVAGHPLHPWLTPHRRRPPFSDPTTPLYDPLSSNSPLPKLSSMTPYTQPLPGIGKRKEPASRQISPARSRQCSGKRRSPTPAMINEDPIMNMFAADKRPLTARNDESDMETGSSDESTSYTQDTIVEIVHNIGSSSGSKRLTNTIRARKLLSMEKNPPIKEFLKAGILSSLIPHMQQHKDTTLQYEATWTLTNLAAGSSDQTRTVVNAGAVPILIELLKAPSIKVREQAAWALGNIAGDGEQQRNFVVSAGIIPPILQALNTTKTDADSSTPPVTLVRVVAWVLANLFRHKGQIINMEQRRDCLNTIKTLLDHEDSEVNADALWAVSYIADLDDDSLQMVLDSGVVGGVVRHLASGQKQKIVPALRATGNLTVGNDEQTDAVVAKGVIPIYGKLIRSRQHNTLRRDAAWALSNLTAGTKGQIQCVVDEGILPDLVAAMSQGSLELQREAAWALGNLTMGGTTEQIKSLVDAGGVAGLAGVLAVTETATVTISLTALHSILKIPELKEGAQKEIEASGGVERLEMLRQYINPGVRDKASEILAEYFGDDEDMSE